MSTVGTRIIDLYGLSQKAEYFGVLYNRYDAWAVGIAGFTPIPYKLFTISAGAFKINFLVFVLASLASRSARFFLVAGLIYVFGPGIRSFIDRYFNILAAVFAVLLIAGFLIIKHLL
jgi:membrane protein YqaA with SNARE-associated domain